MLELEGVQKSFGAVRALRSGSLRADAGSIHALVGENGAGKSTLVKIVAGVHRRDAGAFRFQGEDVDFGSTAESKAAGIAVIYQEPTLFPDLSVTENIFMGRQPLRSGRRIDRGAMYAEAKALFERLGVDLDPRRPARGLSIADQQIIEIAKAISLDAEPPDHGRADRRAERGRGRPALRRRPQPARRGSGPGLHLAPLRRGLRALRHGHRDARRRLRLHRRRSPTPPSTRSSPGWSAARSATSSRRPRPRSATSSSRSRAWSSGGTFHDVSFTVRAGEIVGLAGLVGAGRSEIARAVFGVDSYDAGRGPARRQARHEARPARRDPRRHGVRPRGPPQAGPGHPRPRSPATSPA